MVLLFSFLAAAIESVLMSSLCRLEVTPCKTMWGFPGIKERACHLRPPEQQQWCPTLAGDVFAEHFECMNSIWDSSGFFCFWRAQGSQGLL